MRKILPQVIAAIGQDSFAAAAAEAVGSFLGFDLAAVIVHRPSRRPAVMFDNFDSVDGRAGIENYVGFTHRINPMLAVAPAARAYRARDFTVSTIETDDGVAAHLVRDADEELGFRTIGWPRRMEEIDLYVEACGAVVELGFYRHRGRSAVPARKLRMLDDLIAPVAAAFERHVASIRSSQYQAPRCCRHASARSAASCWPAAHRRRSPCSSTSAGTP